MALQDNEFSIKSGNKVANNKLNEDTNINSSMPKQAEGDLNNKRLDLNNNNSNKRSLDDFFAQNRRRMEAGLPLEKLDPAEFWGGNNPEEDESQDEDSEGDEDENGGKSGGLVDGINNGAVDGNSKKDDKKDGAGGKNIGEKAQDAYDTGKKIADLSKKMGDGAKTAKTGVDLGANALGTGTAATGTTAAGSAALGTTATGTAALGTTAAGTAAAGTTAAGTAAAGTAALGTTATTVGTAAAGTAAAAGSAAAGSGVVALLANPYFWMVIGIIAAVVIVAAASIGLIIFIISSIFYSQSTEANGPPPLSAEDFYGVRIFYKNDEISNQTLLQNYNELAFDFLSSVNGLVDGENKLIIKELKIELPETIVGADFTNYSTDFTNEIVYKIVESVLNTQNIENKEEGEEDPELVVVTQENLTDSLTLIDHFGLTYTDYEAITKKLLEHFVAKVDAGVATTDNDTDDILTFETTYSYNKDDFSSKVTTVFTNEIFNRYKVSSSKIYVKDVLAGTEEGINVNGVITSYIYMAKKEVALKNKHYGVQIADNSKYAISVIEVTGENSTISEPVIADKTWIKTGAELKANGKFGDATMFLDDKASYYNEQLEVDHDLNCVEFTNIDANNTAFLSKNDFSVLDAYNESLDSANICFNISANEEHAEFISINAMPSVYVGLLFLDVTENGPGTPFILADLE